MKMRNKGKVHPFTTSSSSSSSQSKDSFSVLKLLPAAIFTLVSVLSLEDREVLAYMITRSIKTTNPCAADDNKKMMRSSSKKQSFDGGHGNMTSPALFDCECFHCYTSFWCRWDCSPNRELIHQAIEAFEEHLSNGEEFKNGGGGSNGKSRRKEKMGRRRNERIGGGGGGGGGCVGVLDLPAVEQPGSLVLEVAAAADVDVDLEPVSGFGQVADEVVVAAAGAPAVNSQHKGFARKVLPDVMGILNSRLWSLWSPNV